MSTLLEVNDLSVAYGKIIAVKGISFNVDKGEIVTLIGSNGAGKSTTLRTISGLLAPKSGTIIFKGEQISGLQGHDVVKKGITQSPEGRRIFPRMTVSENLDLGAFLRNDKSEIAADFDRVLELFPRLRERLAQKAGTMSGGEQQMLAVARAMMGRPELLLLDEPSMGLAPVLVELIFETIVKIREQGTTILLVEQNALAALDVADRAYVLESGSVKMSGNASELASNDEVTKAYLGG
ncbi:MAG: ABC transporter ATP-binding protein [Actinobacteria bacterium]|nr:ABC transporter ATP-binding protein [Actinomycetota bacterium]